MNRMRIVAALAAMAACGLSVTQANTLGRHSFSSSIIASAIAKFHGVKDAAPTRLRTVATAIQVEVPAVKQDPAPIKADVVTKKDAPQPSAPIKADVVSKKDAPAVQEPAPIKADVVQKKDVQTPAPLKADVVSKKDAPIQATVQKQPETKPAEQKPADKITAEQKTPAPLTTPTAPTVVTPQPTTTPKTASSDGTVTNTFTGEDIKQVMSEVGALAGVTIVSDDTVKEQNITIEFKGDSIEVAVEKLALMAGAYWKQQSPGFFLVSKATSEAALFSRFAETKIYQVKNQNASSIQSVLSPSYKNYVSVDPKSNTIGVCAPKQLLEKIISDIQKADMPGRQISIEALVTEITVDDSLSSGFSWTKGNTSLGTDLSITSQAASIGDMVKIQAAIKNNKMSLRANPHLIATAGVESMVNVGQDTYYSLLSGSTIYPTSQIQLIHTGVTLKFTALVGDDGMITMYLDPSVSDAVTNVSGNPTSNIRTANTKIRVKSGQTIVIAGLLQDTISRQTVRVPFLGSIPLLGEIFTQRTNSKKKIETVFLITPKLIEGS